MAIAKNGRDVISLGKRGGDEFGKGIVGKHSETESEEKQNQHGLGTPSITYGGGHFEEEKAGLEDGVSARETINPDEVEPEYNYDVDSFTGNAPERKTGRVVNMAVSGKGKKFNIGEF
jgi:hypothetical protein